MLTISSHTCTITIFVQLHSLRRQSNYIHCVTLDGRKQSVNCPGRPSMDIIVKSWQDLGKILAKIVTRYCQELQDAMVRSYQESHVSKKNLTKKPNMARKILLRSPIWQKKSN